MLEQLKNLAIQKLQEKMSGNSLNEEATNEAANEGASALLDSLKGGDLSQITALFGGSEGGANGIMENIQGKLSQIMQNKGMNAEEAQSESTSTTSDLINGLKEKFQSNAAEDNDFDLSNITNLIGGDTGALLSKAASFFGK